MKKIYTVLSILLVTFILIGCSGKKEGVTIFVYGQTHERGIYQKIIEKFTEETGIKVDAQLVNADGYQSTLSASLGTKNAPDVFYVNPSDIGTLANNRVILDLIPYLEAEIEADGFDYNQFMEETLKYYKYDVSTKKRGEGDSLWAIPKDTSSYPLAYNRLIVNRAVENGRWELETKKGIWADREGGMPLPWEADPLEEGNTQIVYTWEEFTNACRALAFTEDNTTFFGTALLDTWAMHSWIWSAGGDWLSADGKTVTVNTPEFINGFTEFIELMDYRGVSQTREQMGIKPHYDRWMSGEVGFFNVGVWDVAAFESVSKDILDYGLMPTPRLNREEGSTWFTYVGTLGYAVSAKSQVPEDAVKLALYMSLSDESYIRMTERQTIQLPNSKEKIAEYIADDKIKPENKQIFLEVIENGHGKLHPTAQAYNSLWYDAFIDELSRVWKVTDNDTKGEMTPAEYAAYIQPKMQELLNYALEDEEAGF